MNSSPPRSEREIMLTGGLYCADDPELEAMRLRTRQLLQRFNHSSPDDLVARTAILTELLGASPHGLFIEPPFYCDYGQHIVLGRDVYMNFGCTILDVCPVHIGNRVLLAPHVQMYAATHPVDVASRRQGHECGKPISIGDDCWIGGHTVILPGVTIGEGSTIGAGSVVTRDIPPHVAAVGNPCRVIKKLQPAP